VNSMLPMPRENFRIALEGKQPQGLVPHFELRFFPTMEVFGRVHPQHRNYDQWDQMSERERQLHRKDMADLLVKIAENFHHSAILLSNACTPHSYATRVDEYVRQIEHIREISSEKYFLLHHGDATFAIPPGDKITEFSYRIIDDSSGLKKDAQKAIDNAIEIAEKYFVGSGLDGFALCSDYCFNSGPFLSPSQFSEFIAPYLEQLIKAYRDMGFYVIKHSDGNIMPIIDQIVQCKPHALHSLDPQGGVDIAEVKKRFGNEVCLIGNVNCGLLGNGTDEQCVESVRYALRNGMPRGGYILSTSNCIYTGMNPERYELMLKVWQEEGCS